MRDLTEDVTGNFVIRIQYFLTLIYISQQGCGDGGEPEPDPPYVAHFAQSGSRSRSRLEHSIRSRGV